MCPEKTAFASTAPRRGEAASGRRAERSGHAGQNLRIFLQGKERELTGALRGIVRPRPQRPYDKRDNIVSHRQSLPGGHRGFIPVLRVEWIMDGHLFRGLHQFHEPVSPAGGCPNSANIQTETGKTRRRSGRIPPPTGRKPGRRQTGVRSGADTASGLPGCRIPNRCSAPPAIASESATRRRPSLTGTT